ncbi:hypothetical protein AB2T90_17155 [Clostridium butyricum]|uniref:hypothetical protein n=1 Tax=Clostridium butyricum TaxID=1492 RepID=UPI003466E5C8
MRISEKFKMLSDNSIKQQEELVKIIVSKDFKKARQFNRICSSTFRLLIEFSNSIKKDLEDIKATECDKKIIDAFLENFINFENIIDRLVDFLNNQSMELLKKEDYENYKYCQDMLNDTMRLYTLIK